MARSATESNRTAQNTEALYREHAVAVAALCRSLLRDRNETEDATQQVFLSAHRALLNGAAPREPRAWLLAVARNECYARFRRRAVASEPAGETPATADASAQVLRAGELANVWDEVGRMPPTQRQAFLLREIRGLSYAQLADELSLSPPSVRSLLLRARTRLRRRLGDVAAGLGGAPWVQALLRLVGGGDGASPVPAATKAAAVGIGALALAGGGDVVARHAPRTPRHASAHHRAAVHVHRLAAPAAVLPRDDGPGHEARPPLEHSTRRDDGSRESGSGRVGAARGSDEQDSRSSGEGSGERGHDGSDDSAAIAEPSTDGPGGGGSSASRDGSSGSSRDGSDDHGTSGLSTSDGGSGSAATAPSSASGSGGSGSGSRESGGSDSSGGSGSSHGSDGDGSSGDGGHAG